MASQDQKYHLSMSGEFYVAAELQRRGLSAAVTYGNAKRADVVAFSVSGERVVVVEVKSTSQTSWVVGGTVPPASKKPWVFVYFPKELNEAPSFYVLLQSELHDILSPVAANYRRRYKEKHGEEYGNRRGVENLLRKQIEQHKNAWGKIANQLSPPT